MAVAAMDGVPLVSAGDDERDISGHEELSSGDVRRRIGRAGRAAVAILLVAACAGLTWRRAVGRVRISAKPFRLYEGELAMPDRSDQYDGVNETRPITVEETETEWGNEVRVFVIGDWGATLPDHCTYPCSEDGDAQFKVAGAMKARAEWAKPQYVLNVGDNFYVEGLEQSCNAPPNDNPDVTKETFQSGWGDIYGPVAEIPWLSVLGNHDYGGWRFDKGWPQQVGYSFMNHNWIMPARYYTKRVHHPGYYIDYFMWDSNAFDAKANDEGDQAHNICSMHNCGGIGTCDANGGMWSIESCKEWFWDSHEKQKVWLEEQVAASDARWKIVVTHFPCGYETELYKRLKTEHGLDFIVSVTEGADGH